jgi:hypothetical protein
MSATAGPSTTEDRDDDKLGEVGQVYVDDDTDQPEWITVDTGFSGTSENCVPMRGAEVAGGRVAVAYDRAPVGSSPPTAVCTRAAGTPRRCSRCPRSRAAGSRAAGSRPPAGVRSALVLHDAAPVSTVGPVLDEGPAVAPRSAPPQLGVELLQQPRRDPATGSSPNAG